MNAKAEVIPAQMAPVTTASASTLLQVIERAASNPSADIDKMERLMQMHERLVAREAEVAFNVAMMECQREMRTVGADAVNPQTRSSYATFAKLDAKLRPIYTSHGFALTFNTADCPRPECIRVLAEVLHRNGHKKLYQADMPADGKGAKGGDVMTKTHATGAAMSYGARYLLKSIFNVAVGEHDQDGNSPPEGPEPDAAGKAKLEACGSLHGLQEAWKGLTAAQRKTLAAVKDECKTRIEEADREAAK